MGDNDKRSLAAAVAERQKLSQPVFVTQPTMPSLEDYTRLIQRAWDKKWLTNRGELHQELAQRLSEHLDVKHLSLFCNGTVALLLAMRALGVNGGKVVTTPFTFPATPHSISWLGAEPVFCDIDPKTFNLDPNRLAELVDEETQAIVPVHVYGIPCDVVGMRRIADRYEIPVIYDAAHTFGVRHQGRALSEYGDAAVLSFHATKLFSTAEGGAAVFRDEKTRQVAEHLKNFGIADAETVVAPGLNGKMSELQAAFGLLKLDTIREEIASRLALAAVYRQRLAEIPGIECVDAVGSAEHNGSYFPVLVHSTRYGMTRDQLYECLKESNIITRKYFYPLSSHYPHYRALPSSDPASLPVAEAAARRVLCLPIYGTLGVETVEIICQAIEDLYRLA